MIEDENDNDPKFEEPTAIMRILASFRPGRLIGTVKTVDRMNIQTT